MDPDAAVADLLSRYPRLMQLQIEETGHALAWFGVGLAPPYPPNPTEADYTAADPALWYTDAREFEEMDHDLLRDDLIQFRTDLLDAFAGLRSPLALPMGFAFPRVWHRTTVAPPTDD